MWPTRDCLLFHLQTVFKPDAAETQQKYIRNGLKKPTRGPVRQFLARMLRLNEYLAMLPCLKESCHSTKDTPYVDSYMSIELAKILLEACPATWQDQYKLLYGTEKQVSKENLLDCLENIDDSMKRQALSNNKASDKSNGTDKNGKAVKEYLRGSDSIEEESGKVLPAVQGTRRSSPDSQHV